MQYVAKNQLSPRASLTWQPWWATVIHAGYARNFTPPDQELGRLLQPQLLNNTTGLRLAGHELRMRFCPNGRMCTMSASFSNCCRSARPEPVDCSTKEPIATTNCPALEVGVDAYYKYAQRSHR